MSDTFRSDGLSCYQGPVEAPSICGLADAGTLFERSYSSAPWTLPSSVAMFTGRYPIAHSRHPLGTEGRLEADEKDAFFHVADSETLLAEVLRAQDYATARFTESTVAEQSNPFQGLPENPTWAGTASINEVERQLPHIDVRTRLASTRFRTIVGAMEAILTLPEPFFVVVWIHDPHAAYSPPPAFREALDEKADQLPRDLDFYTGLGHINRPEDGLLNLPRIQDQLAADEFLFLRELYHREIESVDDRVSLLLEALDRRGASDNTYVTFTSDHGEGFGEHGLYLHGNVFYEEMMRVPLIIRGPDVQQGQRSSIPISHIDLMPTLADLLGVSLPYQPDGETRAAELRGSAGPELDRSIYFVSPLKVRHGDALLRDGYKLIVNRDQYELYDLANDPFESVNLQEREPDRVRSMLREISHLRRSTEAARQTHLAKLSGVDVGGLAASTREQLEAMGYLD